METNKLFTVTPMSHRFTLDPGQTYTGSLTIVNPANSTDDFHYKVSLAPYGVTEGTDGVDFITESSYTKITKWITIDKPTGTLQPNQTAKVHFTIKVPTDADAGGQYAAIIISRDEDINVKDDNIAINDVFEVASLIYAQVTGDIKHDGEIVENSIPSFVSSSPITLSATLKNTGNVHDNATIIIKATDFFTGQVIVGNDTNHGEYSEIIMPESTRQVTRDISEGLPLLGIVHIEQKITWNDQVSEESRDVIICPPWFIVAICAVLALIVSFIVRKILRRRHNNHSNKP